MEKLHPIDISGLEPRIRSGPRIVATTPEVDALIGAGAVIALAVSGGKDGSAMAIAVAKHLDRVGHTGPRVLIHSDLGRIEWKDSLPSCERLAAILGYELIVVRRKAGDMLARWNGRWANNVARYESLSCVKLILPWSTPSMRFCTSELKTAVITSALKKRFPAHDILNVLGIRRQESANRRKAAISSPEPRLMRRDHVGVTWNAVIEWLVGDVWDEIAESGLVAHEAYTRYRSSRVSCCACIMSSESDLLAAAACEDNHDVFRSLVGLEARSTFAFQGSRWLADVASHLLDDELRERVALAKATAVIRQAAEARLPKYLLFTKGWPTCMPTDDEAELIAAVRRDVAGAIGLQAACLDAESVSRRYRQLLDEKAAA